MSLLNLNSSAGRGPRGKKSLKMFMGAGLLVAVLGIGSTLAANITINSPEGTSEFGQGVTQTIFCGSDESATVKVTPAASYTFSNTPKTVSINYINNTSSTGNTTVAPVTIYGSTSSNLPRFSSYSTSAKIGWWLSSSSTTATPIATQPSFDQVSTSPSSYFFTERDSDGKFKKPASSSPSTTTSVLFSDETSNFKLGRVTISQIPAACSGVNFILSNYSATGVAYSFTQGSTAIREVSQLWNAGSSDTFPSRSRTTWSTTKVGSVCTVTGEQDGSSLTFSFASPNIPAANLSKLVLETQENIIGTGSSCSS